MTEEQIACLRLFAYAVGHDDRVSVETRITAKALHTALSNTEAETEHDDG